MRTTPQREGRGPAVESASPATKPDVKRRRFLLALGAGGAAGAAGAAVAAPAMAAPIVQAAAAPAEDRRGYRETEHVRDYYQTTRI